MKKLFKVLEFPLLGIRAEESGSWRESGTTCKSTVHATLGMGKGLARKKSDNSVHQWEISPFVTKTFSLYICMFQNMTMHGNTTSVPMTGRASTCCVRFHMATSQLTCFVLALPLGQPFGHRGQEALQPMQQQLRKMPVRKKLTTSVQNIG